MAVSALRRLAAASPAAVYPVIGRNALTAVEELSLAVDIAIEVSPRRASLLLVAGDIRDRDVAELRQLHDQLPHPRATVWWRTEPDPAFAGPISIGADESAEGRIVATYRALMAGEQASEDDLLPDEPPAPWRGRGDHGQGGEGMMGGQPYGRPMPMTNDDLRDGLALDAYAALLGPFLPMFPPGLLLDVTLQGDVIQRAEVLRAPFAQEDEDTSADPLRCIARVLRVLGLGGQAQRFLRVARARADGNAPALEGLRRTLAWSGALHAIPEGLGAFGPTDARSRVQRWWERAIEAPGGREQPGGGAGTAAGTVGDGRMVDMLPGLEWSEAVLVLNSFTPAELRRMCPVDPGQDDEADAEPPQ